jgi:thymidylate kinase
MKIAIEGNHGSGKTTYIQKLINDGYRVVTSSDTNFESFIRENYLVSNWKPDFIIYLYCEPSICYERIQSKSLGFSLADLQAIHIQNEIAFDDLNCPYPIYKICSQEDITIVYNSIIDIIEKNGANLLRNDILTRS